MTDSETTLDAAHAAMQSGDDCARLAFYERLAATELILLLEAEPVGDDLEPVVAETTEGQFVLVFDTEERLATFAKATVPYAGIPGRALVEMLTGQGMGLGLNLDVAPSSMLIPPDGVDWMATLLGNRPAVRSAQPVAIHAPTGLPAPVLASLEARLAAAGGLAAKAILARADYVDGSTGSLLAFIGADPRSEPSLAQMVAEAISFSGMDAGSIDVVFLAPDDLLTAPLVRQGLEIALPAPTRPEPRTPKAPGMDGVPPKLR